MDEKNPGKKDVSEKVAKGDGVIRAVQEAVDESLLESKDAVASSERDLDEAEELYEEAEGEKHSDPD
jgi:hypothetical protein